MLQPATASEGICDQKQASRNKVAPACYGADALGTTKEDLQQAFVSIRKHSIGNLSNLLKEHNIAIAPAQT